MYDTYYQFQEEGNAIVQTPDDGYILVGRNILGLCAIRLNAYGDTIWYRIFPGGAGADIIKTNDNNYIILGGYSNITKIDIMGNIIWTKGPFDPYIKTISLKETIEGNFILCGWKDTLGIISHPYLLKLNPNAEIIWKKVFRTNIFEGYFSHVTISSDNNYLLTGSYSDSPDTITSELFFMKSDTTGNTLFFFGYDTIRRCYSEFIYQNSGNSIVVGGHYDTGPFLSEINISGNIQWFYRYINNVHNASYHVTNTNDNGYALTGWWDTTGSGIPKYAFLLKTDSNGIEQFRKVYLYVPLDINAGYDIEQTSDSGYIISGSRANQNVIAIIAIKTDRYGNTNIIGIEPINTNIPEAFKLYQNYPNPFNPITSIKFDIPINGQVSLKIYDITGREILSINEYKKAGSYEVKFDGTNFASGLYLYKIESGSDAETKKMVLLK